MTNKRVKQRTVPLVALLVGATLVVTASPGAAEGILTVEGVLEVGTVDPWSDGSSGGGGYNYGPGLVDPPAETWETCFISCSLFEITHTEDTESEHSDQAVWYYYESLSNDQSGYYVDVLGGTVFMKVASGDVEESSGSGGSASAVHREYESYSNSLGISNSHLEEQFYEAESATSQSSAVSRLQADAGVDTEIVGADVDLTREQDGVENYANHAESSGSNLTQDEFLGIPIWEEGDSQSSFLEEESERFWNRTVANGNVWLLNPIDSTRVEVVGLTLDKGDEAGSGSGSSSSSSDQHMSIFGFNFYEAGNYNEGAYDYAFFNEWLHLTVDLVDGTVTGGMSYEHGNSQSSGSSTEGQYTNVLGIPLYAEEHYEEYDVESEWRNVELTLDAANGVGRLDVGAWDEDSTAYSAYEDTYTIIGFPVGAQGEETTTVHRDGVGLGLQVGEGVLWLGATYENRTEESSSVDDITLGGNPLVGLSSTSRDVSRSIRVGGGSNALGTSANVFWENESSSSSDFLRLGGEEFAGITHEEQHTAYGAGAELLGGVFVFEMIYTYGSTEDAIVIGGFPLGVRDEYQEFEVGTGGAVPNPQGGNLLVYSFEHSETAHDYTLFAGESDIGHAQHNVTSDRVSVLVLDGAAGLEAGREFSNTAVFAGEDTELGDASALQADGEAWAPTVVGDDASVGGTVWFGYIEGVDAIAFGLLIATICANPGVPIPYGTVLGLIPSGEARAAAELALGVAALALCGVPIFAPVPFVLLSPCILVPVAHGIVFAAAGGLQGTLPAVARGVYGAGVNAAGSLSWMAYDATTDVTDGCIWLTIPDEVRNPQPILAALGLVSMGADAALENVWPAYDDARHQAYGVVDRMFNADHLVANPDGIMSPAQIVGEVNGATAALPVQPPVTPPGVPTPDPVSVTPPVPVPAIPSLPRLPALPPIPA